MFALSGAAAGAGDELEALLKQKFLEMVQRKQLAQGDRRLGQEDRSLDMQGSRDAVSAELGRRRATVDEGGLKLGQDRHGEDVRQFDALAPTREAGVAHTQALTGELKRKPEAEQQDRDFTTQRDKTNYGYDLGKIRAQGDQQVRVGSIRTQGAPPSPYAAERGTRIQQGVDNLVGRVSKWTAGPGSLLANIPATEARDFQADLATLKGNIAFSELTEMREASKTGGALGSVALRELELLESALGALDQGQSPQNLVKNLQAIKEVSARWQAAKSGGGAPQAQQQPGAAKPDYRKKYDY